MCGTCKDGIQPSTSQAAFMFDFANLAPSLPLPLAAQPPPPYAPCMTPPNIARILEEEALALDFATFNVRSALAGWAEARRRWESAGSHIEDWEELVGVSLRPIMHQRFATKMHHRFAAKVHRPVR